MLDVVARFRKMIAAILGSLVAGGGLAVAFPDLPAVWATLITTVITAVVVALSPQNEAPSPGLAPDNR
jgi:uncharacterized protein (DUF983 family)